MKYAKFIIALFLIFTSFVGFSQVKEPGDPGGTPSGEPPLGGGAPIGSGTVLLLALGTLYGACKMMPAKQKEKPEIG